MYIHTKSSLYFLEHKIYWIPPWLLHHGLAVSKRCWFRWLASITRIAPLWSSMSKLTFMSRGLRGRRDFLEWVSFIYNLQSLFTMFYLQCLFTMFSYCISSRAAIYIQFLFFSLKAIDMVVSLLLLHLWPKLMDNSYCSWMVVAAFLWGKKEVALLVWYHKKA